MPTTIESLTLEQTQTLERDASEAGDDAMVADCALIARHWSERQSPELRPALSRVVRVISAAEAQQR
jgi:hypothetical protein